jgi:hypothetical protein
VEADEAAAVAAAPAEPDEAAAVAAPPAEPDPEPDLEAEPEPQPGTEEDPWLVEDLADEEPPPGPAGPATEEADITPPAEAGEDVLEETPEFLQETPEHDRLWFEQKPPRDFDWDK